MKKPFKDTKVGAFLQAAAPSIIDTVGVAFPPVKILSALFEKEPGVTPEQKQEFDKLLQDYELNELQAYLGDVQDARSMQVEALKQDDKFSKRFTYYLAAGSLVLGFAYIFLITFSEIPVDNQRFADTILGVVIATVITTIYNFFFGSSKGSVDKNNLLKGSQQ